MQIFDELPARWQTRGDGAGEAAPEELARRVFEQSRRLEGLVRRRDRLETAVALAIAPFFAAVVWLSPHLLARVGAALLTVSCVAIPFRLARARRGFAPGAADRPLLTFLHEERERVSAQRRLLRSIFWWYLLPLGIGVVLLFSGVRSGQAAAIYAVIVAVVYWGIYHLNQRLVASELDPRLAELDALLAAEAEAGEGGAE